MLRSNSREGAELRTGLEPGDSTRVPAFGAYRPGGKRRREKHKCSRDGQCREGTGHTGIWELGGAGCRKDSVQTVWQAESSLSRRHRNERQQVTLLAGGV